MQIAIPLFDGVTSLDVIGPYEVLSRVPGAEIVLVGESIRAYPDEHRNITLSSTATFADVQRPDVVMVPGGPPDSVGPAAMAGVIPAWLGQVHPTTPWTTSLCTGSILLGAAGLGAGKEATTHWAGVGVLRQMGATIVDKRIVVHEADRLIMGAGISAGIDMALLLAEKLTDTARAQGIQLTLQYDPQPPFDAGHPTKAPRAVYEQMCVELKAVL